MQARQHFNQHRTHKGERVPMSQSFVIHQGDCVQVLRSLPERSVHCCVTSPPYFALRDYGHAGQIGLEPTPEAYVAKMVEVFAGVRRVLRDDGCLWLNLGDSYAGSGKGGNPEGSPWSGFVGNAKREASAKAGKPVIPRGCKPKDLIGIPWMVAFALRADGWYLRQWAPWIKRSAMPESVTDRPASACETFFQLTKSADYFYDTEAVKRQAAEVSIARARRGNGGETKLIDGAPGQTPHQLHQPREYDPARPVEETRNLRNTDLFFDSLDAPFGAITDAGGNLLALDVTNSGFGEAHFATYPEDLIEPLILASTSAKGCCPKCGAPWERQVERVRRATRPGKNTKVKTPGKNSRVFQNRDPNHPSERREREDYRPAGEIGNRDPERHVTETKTVGWQPTCKCDAGDPVPCTVIDPFNGAATTGIVALKHGRRYIGCELNPDYIDMSHRRKARWIESNAALFFTPPDPVKESA